MEQPRQSATGELSQVEYIGIVKLSSYFRRRLIIDFVFGLGGRYRGGGQKSKQKKKKKKKEKERGREPGQYPKANYSKYHQSFLDRDSTFNFLPFQRLRRGVVVILFGLMVICFPVSFQYMVMAMVITR